VFISASGIKQRLLEAIEEKIERATMIPRSHGEVTSLFSPLCRKGVLYDLDNLMC